jgi:ParB family chromosome partitioning protein
MATKKRGLGRGLDALLGGVNDPQAAVAVPMDERQPGAEAPDAGGEGVDGSLRRLPLERIHPGRYQPRMAMRPERLDELADSIRAQGVVQPIVVRPQGEAYEIIAGERRWRAAQMAGLAEIPAVVREVPDSAALAISLIENIQREDLNPVEEASALQRLIQEFDMTHQDVADALGRSRASVSNLLRLLTLRPEVRAMLENGDLEMGHARALLALKEDAQVDAAHSVAARGLSVRETEELVRRLLAPPRETPAPRPLDPNLKQLVTDLSDRLGAQVSVQHGNKGKGRLVIHYNDLDELDGILAHIK